jgi:hypothetical protein
MAALGLFAMAAGFTLQIVDRPTPRRQLALFATLVLMFFTHLYRFPFAIATVVGIPVVMYPARRRIKPVIAPLLGALALFGLWMLVRRPGMSGSVGPLSVHRERFVEMPEYLFTGFVGPEEATYSTQMYWVTGGLFVLTTALFFLQGRSRGRTFREIWWGAGITLIPLFMGAACLLAYLVLPMSIGIWWFVYPREITTAGFIALAAMPDLPRQWWLRLPLLAAFAVVSGRLAFVTATNWHLFEEANEDFRAIAAQIPKAPKLMYLIFDHGGSTRRVTPFLHMPVWIQAEKGGWLSFHPAAWGDLHPIRYRPGADVPPPVPERWEWTPERFDLQRNGSYFDTFLVRHYRPPDYLFAADPTIHPVSHVGHWWLYRREPAR